MIALKREEVFTDELKLGMRAHSRQVGGRDERQSS